MLSGAGTQTFCESGKWLPYAAHGEVWDKNGTMLFAYTHPLFWAPYSIIGDGGI
jgi:hypothetical protein